MWNEAQQEAFQTLKCTLTLASVLRFLKFMKPFSLATDASSRGLGSVFMQRYNKLFPTVYADTNYATTEWEAPAVVWTLKYYKDLVCGYPVHVELSDHPSVVELFKYRNNRGKLARWYHTLQDFTPAFDYLEGKTNTEADALSWAVILLLPQHDSLEAEEVALPAS